ncbi:MAG: type II toxin-antitoxin system PemK/MazF family toxin, partial [Bacteroidetes bacterium]|nr:type II toxin-antitoxin system PemK/MazF family toxin [Bacteroidota bacterium]
MEFQQKQIWLINFDPAFGHEFQKTRPGLIIENNFYIPKFELLTILQDFFVHLLSYIFKCFIQGFNSAFIQIFTADSENLQQGK